VRSSPQCSGDPSPIWFSWHPAQGAIDGVRSANGIQNSSMSHRVPDTYSDDPTSSGQAHPNRTATSQRSRKKASGGSGDGPLTNRGLEAQLAATRRRARNHSELHRGWRDSVLDSGAVEYLNRPPRVTSLDQRLPQGATVSQLFTVLGRGRLRIRSFWPVSPWLIIGGQTVRLSNLILVTRTSRNFPSTAAGAAPRRRLCRGG